MVDAKFAKEYGMKQITKQTMSRIMDKDMVDKLLKLKNTCVCQISYKIKNL